MGSNLVPHRVLFCEQHERPATRPTAKPPPTPTHFTMGGKAKPTKHTSKELAKKVPPPVAFAPQTTAQSFYNKRFRGDCSVRRQ